MKITGELPLCRDKIQQILDSPIPSSKGLGEKEAEMCKNLVGTLNEEEVEYAAQGSYAYWLATISGKPPTEEERMRMATREARRHLFKVPYEKACVQIKETVHFRKEQRIDLVRACFLGDDVVEFDNDEDRAKVLELRLLIEADLAKQHAYCRGHDKDGLAIMIQRSRTAANSSSKGSDAAADADDGFVATVLYTMERAIAVTESHSHGALEKIMVVLDFKTFKSSLAPSWNAIKRVATILQNRYPERLKKLVVIDPPFWMRTMYSLLSPFLDPETKAKFVVVSGDAKKQSIISEFIDIDNAMPFLLPHGKLVDAVDINCYLKQVPFCQAYAKI